MTPYSFIAVLFSLLVIDILGTPQPQPKCQPGQFFRTLPLIANQSYITNLDQLFNGYNLQYKLQDHEDFKQYIQLNDKLTLQSKQIPDNPLIGLKSYHIDRKGNAWGSTFIAMTQRSQRTYVHYGVINSNKSAPIVNNYINVENKSDTTCFDAVLFKQQNLILVDCAKKLTQPNQKGQVLQNWFYYFRISDGEMIKKFKTELYINLRSITRRSLNLYSDLQNQHTFLLRTYHYDELLKPYDTNTFIQVFMLTDPNDPWIVEVIDRSFLNTKSLSITDVKIYLGEIFLLDKSRGVYRVAINTEEDLVFKGFYEIKGYDRMAVFSNNLQDNLQIALANSHSALEIDWSVLSQPLLINKYSLMPQSIVTQIFLNPRFLVIQSSSTYEKQTYNYTWIFNRGQRTYTKAFKVIKHDTAKTIIDFNQEMSFLIIIDDEKIVNYKIDDTNMVIEFDKDEQLMDRINSFRIVATSKEEMIPDQVLKCQVVVNFTLLEDDNRTMWPIGEIPPSTYTANYPGKVVIQLKQYVFGPNITYKLRQADHDVIKRAKIYQQQQLTIKWQTQPPFINDSKAKIQFLLSQTINYQHLHNDLMHLYMQDSENVTHFIECTPSHENLVVPCGFTHSEQFEGKINEWVSGFFVNDYTGEQNHLVAYTTTKHYNKVGLIDMTKKQTLTQVQLQRGFAGNATSIAITEKQLYVVLKYVKSIMIYDLQLCLQDLCQPKCKLDHNRMYMLGIKYFSPQKVKTSPYHPNILFIQTSDQLIVIDYNAECTPKLLIMLQPIQSAQLSFSFVINKAHMLITIPELNLIKQYNIQRLSIGEIRQTKAYPRYGNKLNEKNQLDVSDNGKLVYVEMLGEQGDHRVFVYRTGQPAVGSLYDVIQLSSVNNVLVDVTGQQIDYVSVYSDHNLHIFRQYQQPTAQIFNPNISYSFYIDYSNPSSRANLQQIDVKIINLPTYIKVNPWLNDIMNTKDLLYSGDNVVNQVNDSIWWEGNVVTVEADCQDCKGDDPTIKVMNHIQHRQSLTLIPGMSEYQWTNTGGAIQQSSSVLRMNHSGTVNQLIKLPFTQKAICTTLTVPTNEVDFYLFKEYIVSGCLQTGAATLYLTTLIADKPFTFEPFQTPSKSLFKLQATHEMIMLIDTEPDPYSKTRPGGIYLFTVNTDDNLPQSFVLVQYLEGDDLGLQGFVVNNAELTYHKSTDTYRLYVTQMKKGLFVVEFSFNAKENSISIKAQNQLKIQQLLSMYGYQLPYDATYQAVTRMSTSINPTLKKTTDSILLTTGKFHIMQLIIDFSLLDSSLQNIELKRLYQRYAFYDIQNYIKYHNQLFVVSQILPEEFQIQNRSKQLLTIYSTSDNRSFVDDTQEDRETYDDQDDKKIAQNKTMVERGFLGGYRVDDTIMHLFDFNLTFEDDGHTQPRVGMVLIEYLTNKLQKFTLHQNLSVVTKQLVDTQIIYIDLKNDFSLQKIRILINGRSPFPEWLLITIILFGIIGAILLLGIFYVGIVKIKQRLQNGGDNQDMMQDSLLTGSDRKSFQPYRESQQSITDKKQDKKRLKQQQKEEKRSKKSQQQRQKQRQRQQKQREKLREKQQKQRSKQQKQRQKQQSAQLRSREKERQREYERQSLRERERERERQRQRQRDRQRDRQIERQRRSRQQSQSVMSNRQASRQNLYEQSRGEQNDLTAPFSGRFADRERRAFRERPQRGTRGANTADQPSSRQPPQRRRNIAIIED